MKLKIFQINLERDTNKVAFAGYDRVINNVDPKIYDIVYNGEVEAKDIEDVFYIFNVNQPDGYEGRSLSVSDIVEVVESEYVHGGFYYCDVVGFQRISFDASQTQPLTKNTIRVVVCEPGKKACVKEIGKGLRALQKVVEGDIEAFYPFESNECIVCNEEGKFNGSSPCRAIFDDEGNIVDVVFGTFFICDCSTEEFGSLSEEKQNKYLKMFGQPEGFVRINGEIKVIKCEEDGYETF